MKNNNIKVAAIASLLTTASATAWAVEPTVYGSLRMGYDAVDANTDDDGWNGRDFLSRIGVKAKVDLEGGLTGLAQVEYGIRDDNLVDINQNGQPTLRLANVGLKGDFGTVYYGSQTLVWHKFVRGAYFSDGNDSLRQATIRDDDLLQYYYKSGGFTFGAGLQAEGQDGDSFDQYQVGAEYKTGGVKLQAAYSKDNRGDNTGGLLGVRVWYTVGDVTLSAFTHRADEDYDLYGGNATGNVRLRDSAVNGRVNGVTGCKTEERSTDGVYARYKAGSNQVHARYAVNSCDVSGDVSSVKVEYIRYLGKKYRLWASYETLDSDDTRLPSTGDDMSEIQLGVRVDF